MKYYSRSNTYKASNVIYDCNTKEAYSYGWWRFVECIGNKTVFNWYKYSSSTSAQQRKIAGVLRQLNIKIDIEIDAPKGLQDLNSAIVYYNKEIEQLKETIAKPKTHIRLNIERQGRIEYYQKQIQVVKMLIACKESVGRILYG